MRLLVYLANDLRPRPPLIHRETSNEKRVVSEEAVRRNQSES